jgi:hypothetical protein
MTITHSVLSISFGRNGSRTSATQQAQYSAAPASCEPPGGMTCSPWEGLYFATAESESSDEATVPNPELERFLASLMFGE